MLPSERICNSSDMSSCCYLHTLLNLCTQLHSFLGYQDKDIGIPVIDNRVSADFMLRHSLSLDSSPNRVHPVRLTLTSGIIAQSSVALTPVASSHCSVKMFHIQHPALLHAFSFMTLPAEHLVSALRVACLHAKFPVKGRSLSL